MSSVDTLLTQEFPLHEELIYLNHAAVAPWPQRTAAAICDFSIKCVNEGATHYPEWLRIEQQCRDRLCQLINAPSSDDIALLKNTSEALSVVAHGFPFKTNDNIVISNEEFPSNRIVWESLQPNGVEVRQVALQHPDGPEAALLTACDANTRLISISSVEYASGVRFDIALLGEQCKERGIALCVDAIQGLGAIAHDVQGMHIDFLMADAHKWLLAPEGIAVFYCSAAWRDKLQLHQYGWHMVEDHFNFDRRDWQPAASARRFECGSPNMLGIYGLNASLSLLLEIGMDIVEQRILEHTDYLHQSLNLNPDLLVLSDPTPGRYAGIITFRHQEHDNTALFHYLRNQNVVCAERGGGIRFSPHCYTTIAHLDRALAHVAAFKGD